MKIISGNSNRGLASLIVGHLNTKLVDAVVTTFSDGEINVDIKENMRGKDVFVIQSTCKPVNRNAMELLIIIDALKRASAKRITSVIPYYGYGRQDRKVAPRVPITAKLIADLLTTAGTHRVLTMDLHAGQIQGFFNIPVDHLYASSVLLNYLRKNLAEELVIVAPDAGAAEMARAYAKRLGAGLAIIDKRREKANDSEVMNIIGVVEGMTAILLDDMVDTAGTLCNSAYAVMEKGAKEVHACCTHAVLSGPAVKKISRSPLKQIIVSDTIPLSEEAKALEQLKVVSVSKLFADAIEGIYTDGSLSALFI